MKLIVGLGNPGQKYSNTRHNAGFIVVDELHDQNLPKDIIVRKSDKQMNESGACINVLLHEYKVDPSDLYVIHDDLDIPLGSFKIQFGKGPKKHNGVLDVEDKLGTSDFWRVRVGIENRLRETPDGTKQCFAGTGKEYVLQDFSDEERKILDETIKKICKKLATLLTNTN